MIFNKYFKASLAIWLVMIPLGFSKGIGLEVIAFGLSMYFIALLIIAMIEQWIETSHNVQKGKEDLE